MPVAERAAWGGPRSGCLARAASRSPGGAAGDRLFRPARTLRFHRARVRSWEGRPSGRGEESAAPPGREARAMPCFRRGRRPSCRAWPGGRTAERIVISRRGRAGAPSPPDGWNPPPRPLWT